MWNDLVSYLQNNAFDILVQVRDHLTVSLIALFVACVIGVPIGYFASESAKGERIMTIPFEILRVVPSLAILVLLIPVLGTGTALAAKIGAGGLGEIIFTGLGLNRADLLIIGGVLVAVLSLGSGFLFDLVTGHVLRYKRAAG